MSLEFDPAPQQKVTQISSIHQARGESLSPLSSEEIESLVMNLFASKQKSAEAEALLQTHIQQTEVSHSLVERLKLKPNPFRPKTHWNHRGMLAIVRLLGEAKGKEVSEALAWVSENSLYVISSKGVNPIYTMLVAFLPLLIFWVFLVVFSTSQEFARTSKGLDVVFKYMFAFMFLESFVIFFWHDPMHRRLVKQGLLSWEKTPHPQTLGRAITLAHNNHLKADAVLEAHLVCVLKEGVTPFLNPRERSRLYQKLGSEKPSLVLAILEYLEVTVDISAIQPVERLARKAGTEAVRTKAELVLAKLIQQREQENQPRVLLRAADAPQEPPKELLLPVKSLQEDSTELLLPSDKPDEPKP